MQDTEKALANAHGQFLRARKLVVTYAHQAPLDSTPATSSKLGRRGNMSETGRPTTLSLIKTGMSVGHGRGARCVPFFLLAGRRVSEISIQEQKIRSQ